MPAHGSPSELLLLPRSPILLLLPKEQPLTRALFAWSVHSVQIR